MAWTPGLVLDYARSLRVAMDQPPLGLVALASLGANMMRAERHRRELVAAARTRTALSTENLKAAAQAVQGSGDAAGPKAGQS